MFYSLASHGHYRLYHFADRNPSVLGKKAFTTNFSVTGSNVSFFIQLSLKGLFSKCPCVFPRFSHYFSTIVEQAALDFFGTSFVQMTFSERAGDQRYLNLLFLNHLPNSAFVSVLYAFFKDSVMNQYVTSL